jgi:phosphohistidine phosphatase SixA
MSGARAPIGGGGIPRSGLVLSLVLLVNLCSQPANAQAALVILARHAEKAAPSGDPGLTAAGDQRANDLATALSGVRLAAIITTQYRRSQLTAAPIARTTGLQPLVIAATGDMKASADAVARTLDSLPQGSVALVVGHSNTLGPIIVALGGPQVPDLCDGEHSTLLVLARPGGAAGTSLLRSRYGAGEPPEASQCR